MIKRTKILRHNPVWTVNTEGYKDVKGYNVGIVAGGWDFAAPPDYMEEEAKIVFANEVKFIRKISGSGTGEAIFSVNYQC